MKKNGRWGCFFAAVLFLIASPAFARDWKATDSDLPSQLKGMSQDQLDVVNKTDELNPAFPDKFNPAALKFFLQFSPPPTARTGHDTTVLPPVSPTFSSQIGGNPSGTGLGPSPSDGPVVRPGEPAGKPVTKKEAPAEREANEANFGAFFAQFFVGEQEFEEDFGFDPFRRSGSRFGDCVGADCIPHIGFPGEPLGGPPFGSWVQYDRSHSSFLFSRDAAVIDAVRNNNFVGAEGLIRAASGQDVRQDPRGRGL